MPWPPEKLKAYRQTEKYREYRRQYWAKQRNKWIIENGPCTYCGSSERLEVDHINTKTKDRKYSLSLFSRPHQARANELKKCQVLCHECHAKKTKAERFRHGAGRYGKGCRCEVCVTDKNSYSREWKRRARDKNRVVTIAWLLMVSSGLTQMKVIPRSI